MIRSAYREVREQVTDLAIEQCDCSSAPFSADQPNGLICSERTNKRPYNLYLYIKDNLSGKNHSFLLKCSSMYKGRRL